MGRYSSKSCRLITMMVLTSSFFFAEIITGYTTHSLALIADSFHMLLDIIALVVGFVAVKMSVKSTDKNTFGWQRAEVLGALVNSVFLMALCFTICVEALQRFIMIEEITDPHLLLIIGSIGLVVNCLGLFLFSSHGMAHGHSHGGGGGHGHSHGGGHKKTPKHDHHHDTPQQPAPPHITNTRSDLEIVVQDKPRDVEDYVRSFLKKKTIGNFGYRKMHLKTQGQIEEEQLEGSDVHLTMERSAELQHYDVDVEAGQGSSSAQLNMRGVFLHVLGDALGSVVVIISALIIMFTDGEWRFYIDPALSLVIVFIIVSTTIPLFIQSSSILLQSIPRGVNIFDIESRLVTKVSGIENIHEFHVWQLTGDKIIATAHIRFRSVRDYMEAAKEMKTFLHDEGIHSTTIQPEFSEEMSVSSTDKLCSCLLMCPSDKCRPKTCCGIKEKKTPKPQSSSDDEQPNTWQIATQRLEDELDQTPAELSADQSS
ncbi:proton-coupled zinc antiporter SLC30A1-like [Amphiura filiformis]|uniref:proton-coupled zinc antiporter SLC30A1-like n=1 Tax=Amphiura filiformis TaxID=82378 RepID=UPI003B215234